MVQDDVLKQIQSALAGGEKREAKAKRIAELIRAALGFRWAGIYEVVEPEIAALGWTGSEPPAYLRFPMSRGLTGAAVKARAPIVVGDVTKDSRYLVFMGDTRSEMIVPVMNEFGAVLGTVNIESERANAFRDEDLKVARECAAKLVSLFSAPK